MPTVPKLCLARLLSEQVAFDKNAIFHIIARLTLDIHIYVIFQNVAVNLFMMIISLSDKLNTRILRINVKIKSCQI